MPDPIVIAAAQPESIPHDVVGNAERHARAIRASGARVVVFPEMSLTGYAFDATTVDLADDRLLPLVAACAEAGAVGLDVPSRRLLHVLTSTCELLLFTSDIG